MSSKQVESSTLKVESGEKAEAAFQPGDVVQLNSGGPAMTVSECEGDKLNCVWFTEGVLSRGGGFSKATLRRIEV